MNHSDLIIEFDAVYNDMPARILYSTIEAMDFTDKLQALDISYRMILREPPKRLGRPLETIIVLLQQPDEVPN